MSSEDAADLIRDVGEFEVWNAVRMLPMGKAPGVDGFGASFFRLPLVKGNVTDAVLHCFNNNLFQRSWKRTVVTLIPKHDGPALGLLAHQPMYLSLQGMRQTHGQKAGAATF